SDMKKNRGKPREGKSLRWMVTMLMLLMGAFGWGIAAGNYASDLQGWGPDSHYDEEIVVVNPVIEFAGGAARFAWNAVIQIPSAHRVVWYTIVSHPGVLVVIALLEGSVWFFGRWLARVERQLAEEDKKLDRRYGRR